jgi:AcrR family transcriptional regulator
VTATRPRRTSAETREHVLAVSEELFYRDGIRATGIDRVAAAAAVAPTTLYRLFASKDDLVVAYLTRAAGEYLGGVDRALATPGTPRERLLAAVAAQAADTAAEGFHGCPFLIALSEFPDPAHPAHRAAVRVKAAVLARLRAVVDELAGQQPVGDPAGLAEQLMLLLEGVYATVQAFGHDGPARQARLLAGLAIEAATARD